MKTKIPNIHYSVFSNGVRMYTEHEKIFVPKNEIKPMIEDLIACLELMAKPVTLPAFQSIHETRPKPNPHNKGEKNDDKN